MKGVEMDIDDDLREQARKRVAKRRDLGAHFVTYCVVNAMFIGMWAIEKRPNLRCSSSHGGSVASA